MGPAKVEVQRIDYPELKTPGGDERLRELKRHALGENA